MLGKIRIVHAGGYDPRQGRTIDPTLEPSPLPAMTPSPSPPAPTSPDGESASCGPLASTERRGDAWSTATNVRVEFWRPVTVCSLPGRELVASVPAQLSAPILPAICTCRACGSGQLTQSDTSDHPGVVRCVACGFVQTA